MSAYQRPLWRRFALDESAAVLVEMTIITPLMIVLAAGTFEFSNIIQKKLLIEAGVKDAARYYARCSDLPATCTTRAQNLAASGSVSGSSGRVSGFVAGDVTVDTSKQFLAVDANGIKQYRSNTEYVVVVRVTASYDYVDVGLLGVLGIGPITLSALHEERVVGW